MRTFRSVVLPLLFVLAIALIPLTSMALSIGDVRNPQTAYNGWVADEADVLNTYTETRLNEMISAFEADTRAEIAVVTVPQVPENTTPRAFGLRLFNQWGIGKAVQNNGVLLLLSMGDRRVELITGRGIESMLTDAEAQAIINAKMLPSLSRDRPNEAVLEGTNAVIEELEQELTQGQPGLSASLNLPEGVPLAIAGPGAIAGLAFILSILLGVKALQHRRSPAPVKPFEYSQWLWLDDEQKAQIRDWKVKKARHDGTLRRFYAGSFFLGTYAVTSVVFTVVAYRDPRWMAAAVGLSIPVIFACKNVPRLRPSSDRVPLPHKRFTIGQFVWSTVGALMFYGVCGLFGTGIVADLDAPLSPIYAMGLAMIVSGFTTINWRDFEERSSSGRSPTSPAGYGSGASSGGASGGSYGGGSSGGGFGGGSSDGGGAGGGW